MVAESQKRLKNYEEGGRGLKMVEEIRGRQMNGFDRTIRSRKTV
jgi:hypothetical protein